LATFAYIGCGSAPTTDQKQAEAQAAALAEAHSQIGMPAITNFAERRMMKDLLERRDKPFPTHTYIFNEHQSCLDYLGPSIGYGLPYAAQYTSPTQVQDISRSSSHYQWEQVPQAEPNGLFMPASAEGTWVMLKDPNSDDVQPIYVEPRIVVSPFRLTARECKPETPPKTQ
jgi:hypothetical protein